ncbi:MAG: ATP-binding protein [Pseudomonadales bacterium]|nr:ATP-binding protein [Pseudomonadales bacterium]
MENFKSKDHAGETKPIKLVASQPCEVERECESHGKYIAKLQRLELVGRDYETGCPQCQQGREQAEVAHRLAERRAHDARVLESQLGRAGIPKRFRSKTFDNFHADTLDKKRVLEAVRKYSENFKEAQDLGRCLILTGKTGTGKTHLVNALANDLVARNYAPVFITVLDLVNSIKKTWRRDSERSEDELIQGYTDGCDLLIIDEVGVQFESDTEKLILFDIINKRYEDMKPTVIISNYPIDSANGSSIRKAIGDRVLDRLREGGGSQITFDWDSYRGGN